MKQQNLFSIERKHTRASKPSALLRTAFFALSVTTVGFFGTVDIKAQDSSVKQAPPIAAKPDASKKFRLRITKGDVPGVSLKAEEAKMTEIAAELSKRLGTQVILGPSMKNELLTVEFADLPLEMALRLLAPKAYVDYEVRANAQPTMLGVYLMGADDPIPAANAIVQATSEAMLFEGNTEDSTSATEVNTEEDPLQVDLKGNNLTIKSKKQSLLVVLMRTADVLGVPAEIKYDSAEIVDVNIKDTPFEDAIPRLSPNIRLYVRADLKRSQRTALRLRLVAPAKPTAPDTGNQ